jgi:hypothetical protein
VFDRKLRVAVPSAWKWARSASKTYHICKAHFVSPFDTFHRLTGEMRLETKGLKTYVV